MHTETTELKGIELPSNYIVNHLFTSDEKLMHWGYGEWVEEPDEALVIHLGYTIYVTRLPLSFALDITTPSQCRKLTDND